jgi:hypothetical protein
MGKGHEAKTPHCFQDKIFHHGKLRKSELCGLNAALIIIDELDNGNKESQVLPNTLKSAGVLDLRYTEEHNMRFVFIGATMAKELYDLYRWGVHHCLYNMTVPASYIGHTEFLEMGIIQEFYPLETPEAASRWITEDVCSYNADFRVHIVRANQQTAITIQHACEKHGVDCHNHTSSDRIEDAILCDLFENTLSRHVVLVIKGFYRRANLIPNLWKLRIGATHELHTQCVDNNAQIQGLPGRMTGYWRPAIEGGHKTGLVPRLLRGRCQCTCLTRKRTPSQ